MKLIKYLFMLSLIMTSCGGGGGGEPDKPSPNPDPTPNPTVIEVTGITISPNSLHMVPGSSEQLSATVTPSNATNKTVTWTSSNKSIATVSASGLVKAIKDGSATITAKAGEKTATCTVTVETREIYCIEGETAKVDLSAATDSKAVKDAIAKADAQGATTYKLTGTCYKLGITEAKSTSNPFDGTNAQVIDFTEVTGWPTITKSALLNSSTSQESQQITEELPGVPAEWFCKVNTPMLQEIILPQEVQAIGAKAFFEFAPLEKITAPGVKIVGVQALQATSIKAISLPSATTLCRACAYYCHNLTSAEIPNVTYLGVNGFAVCPRLKSISIPKLKTVMEFTFTESEALTTVELPAATEIKAGAFSYCTALKTVNVANAETIGDSESNYTGPFYGCKSLAEISLPKAKMIGKTAFTNCTSLKSISLPLATIIYERAFDGCVSLTTVEVPEVTTLKEFAFCNSNFTQISLPKATVIEESVFSGNYSLNKLKLTAIGNITLAHQGYSFYSDIIDLTLKANKQADVKDGNIWNGLTWSSITFE